MRLCVTCVYWTLLLVSVISSGLLFLIVASESSKEVSDGTRVIEQDDNISTGAGETSGGETVSLEPKIIDSFPRPTVKTKDEHFNSEESDGKLQSSQDTLEESKSDKNVDVFKESITQQPNLSQGISETGQAVVLTLVDTAAAELQSLAEPRLTADIRSRSSSKNTTVATSSTTTRQLPLASTTTAAPLSVASENDEELTRKQPMAELSSDLPDVLLTIESELTKNFTEVESTEEEPVIIKDAAISEPPEYNDVVTVIAERKIVEDLPAAKTEDTQDPDERDEDVVKQEKILTSAPELDEVAARAKLGGGSGDETAAVILDGLVASGSTDHHHEDIPSFSEWAQKRLEEAEKKKTHPNASIQNPGGPGRGLGGMKVRSKNYASPDCGAKIVAVNPEARSARSVLVSTRDEYMLNTCTSRVWFIVELCEAIQAKKIELANFELFSSSPKDFSVHVSDRFPTREWSPVGQFGAKDQRDIQSFALNPHLFGKFIKIEMHSHYGSEHFCPISLFRAYGTSEFEVLETETDHQETEDNDDDDEDDEDDPLDAESSADSRNLFGSARDAVLRIVKKAAEVLVKTGDPSNKNNITKIQESIEDNIMESTYASCMTPRYMITCYNCTDDRFAGVFELLSCRASHLDSILEISFVNATLRSGEICSFYGVNVGQVSHKADISNGKQDGTSKNDDHPLQRNLRASFIASIFSPEYLVALCNVVATKERRLVLNTSYEIAGSSSVNSSTKIDTGSFESTESNGRVVVSTCVTDSVSGGCKNNGITREPKVSRVSGSSIRETEILTSNPPETIATSAETLVSQIKPTKTLSREDIRKESSVPILEPSKDPNEESVQAEVLTTPSPILNVPTATARNVEETLAAVNIPEATTQSATSVTNIPNLPTRETHDVPIAQHETGHDTPSSTRQEIEQEIKVKQESGEHEAKLSIQEQMSLDSILSDLKDLESEATGIHNGGGHNSNVAAQPIASNAPQQKESVFLRLSNRIKALERNMSLSGQYLEELSKRYKKQVEEMQRSLERATVAMGEESRRGEERELRRSEEISALREEITSLTQSLELLLYDRNSWRSKLSTIFQHFALIVVEIVVLMFVVSYCRRSSAFEDADDSGVSVEEAITRRRSAGAMTSGISATKKPRKRRPSEIASRIAGTYRDLMIDDRNSQESKKEKKKRRKRESAVRMMTNGERDATRMDEGMPGGTMLPSRRSSSIDNPTNHAKQLELSHSRKRPDSAPEYSGGWFSLSDKTKSTEDRVEETEETITKTNEEHPSKVLENSAIEDETRSADEEKISGVAIFRGGGILKAAKLSSPSFMKTALGSRSKRNAKTISGKGDQGAQLRSDNWEWYSRNSTNRSNSASPISERIVAGSSSASPNIGRTNGHHRKTSDESGSSNATNTTSVKKDKKTGSGLRKMVRKLF